MIQKILFIGAIITMIGFLSSCGESSDETYERGFEDGYEQGLYDVCRELKKENSGVRSQLRSCRGY